MQPKAFVPIPHTADRALRIFGRDLADLFRNAARGLISLMTDPDRVRPDRRRRVRIEADDAEALLVSWLERPIFLFDAERFVCADAEIRSLSPNRLTGVLVGERYNAERHVLHCGIKAVTWQGLEIRHVADGLTVDVVFDV